jgi:N-methylhydantoinase A/oxoprolinase/acetone carboxylase beta subunit
VSLTLLPIALGLQDEPLDAAGTQAAFQALTATINEVEVANGKLPKSLDEVAMGFVRVANETMCRPIRCRPMLVDGKQCE